MLPANSTSSWSSEDGSSQPDHAFDRLLPKLVECFGVMMAGFLAGRMGLLSKAESGGLNYFAANFALPAMIFLNLAQLDASDVRWPFVIGILLGKVVVFVVVTVVTLLACRPPDLAKAAIYGIFATHVNDFGLAYPILQSVYGETHPSYPNYIYLIGLISLAILNPIGFLMIEIQRARVESKVTVKCIEPGSLGAPVPVHEPPGKGRRAGRMAGSIAKRILTNPNVFMTVLGALANVIFQGVLPEIMRGILKDFGDTFQGTVLFLLGLQVARTGVRKDANYLVPGLLLGVKMLISPLVTRGTVKLLCSGSQDDDAGLADYGFLYGTVPTAPVVLVYAAQFAMPTDSLALALVLCTLLSGPVMYVSARMLVVQAYDILAYMKQLKETILCISALGVFSCVWVAVLLIISKKWKKPPHLVLLLLIAAQAVMSMGLVVWSSASRSTWTNYLQISAVTGGQLACRFCTVILAIVLFLSSKYTAQGMRRLLPFFFLFGFGLPGVAVLCLLITARPTQSPLVDVDVVPSFLFGDTEACMAVIVLTFCLVTTSGCLLLFHRQRIKETPLPSPDPSPVLSDSSTLSTIQEESDKQEEDADTHSATVSEDKRTPLAKTDKDTWCKPVDDRPEGAPSQRRKKSSSAPVPKPNLTALIGKHYAAWGPPGMKPIVDQKDYSLDNGDIEADRHFTLLLLFCVSMIIGLTTSIWKLLADERTGIFVALEFLDIILNFGQPIMTVLIFGHDLEPITEPMRKFWHKWRKSRTKASTTARRHTPHPVCSTHCSVNISKTFTFFRKKKAVT